MDQKKQYTSIDLLKFMSAFAVICLHTQPFAGCGLLEYFTNVFFVMAVPFFFCTSSFFFHRKTSSLKRYVKRLVQLYLVWFIIEIPYVVSKYDFGSLYGWKLFAWSLCFQNTFWASWFLMALILAMLIVVPLHRKGRKRLLYVIGAISFILSFFACMYNGLVSYLPWAGKINAFLYYISAAQSFILAIPYCIMGIILVNADLRLSFKKEVLVLLALVALAIAEAYLCIPLYARMNASLLIMPIVFMTVYIALRHEVKISSAVAVFMRKTSIIIYLLHCIVIHFLIKYAGFGYGMGLALLTSVITLAAACLIVYLSRYIKPLKYLY